MLFLWLPFTLLLIAWAIAGYKGKSLSDAVKLQSLAAGILLVLALTAHHVLPFLANQHIYNFVLSAGGLILLTLAFFNFASSSSSSYPAERRRDRDRDRDPIRDRQRRNNKGRRRFSEGEDPGEPPTSRPL